MFSRRITTKGMKESILHREQRLEKQLEEQKIVEDQSFEKGE